MTWINDAPDEHSVEMRLIQSVSVLHREEMREGSETVPWLSQWECWTAVRSRELSTQVTVSIHDTDLHQLLYQLPRTLFQNYKNSTYNVGVVKKLKVLYTKILLSSADIFRIKYFFSILKINLIQSWFI